MYTKNKQNETHTKQKDESLYSSKSERDRIKTEIKVKKRQLKYRKFEMLPNRVWKGYLLKYLCRTEQFILSSTCKYCLERCGINSFRFDEEFDADNGYWRENFFNFVHPAQDSTLLIDANRFETMTETQRRQFKYYIVFWHRFGRERRHRKKLRDDNLGANLNSNSNANDAISMDSNHEIAANNNEAQPHVQQQQEEQPALEDKEQKVDADEPATIQIYDEEEEEEDEEDEEEEEDEAVAVVEEEEEAEEDDLYEEDKFEYEENDDRPRGQVLLERFRAEYQSVDHLQEDALLQVAIPCDVECVLIRDCKNRNGELAQWLSSVLCNMPRECPIDWFGLENNNFQDRDVHRICAGLLNRKAQSNLIGLSLSNNSNITDKCVLILLKTIAKKCHSLQFLNLSGCTKLTNKTCQCIVDFFGKTYNDDKVQLNYIDLSGCSRINDKGIEILNQIYLHPQYTPYNVVVRFYVAGTQWKEATDAWSKNIILKPAKR